MNTTLQPQENAFDVDVDGTSIEIWANPFAPRRDPGSLVQDGLVTALLHEAKLADEDGAHPSVGESLRNEAYQVFLHPTIDDSDLEVFIVDDRQLFANA